MICSFVYRALVSCIVHSFVCVFRIVRSFHFVCLCIVRSFRVFVSCIVRFSHRSCESFVRFSFRLRFSYRSCEAFVRLSLRLRFSFALRLVRIVNLYDPGSVSPLTR